LPVISPHNNHFFIIIKLIIIPVYQLYFDTNFFSNRVSIFNPDLPFIFFIIFARWWPFQLFFIIDIDASGKRLYDIFFYFLGGFLWFALQILCVCNPFSRGFCKVICLRQRILYLVNSFYVTLIVHFCTGCWKMYYTVFVNPFINFGVACRCQNKKRNEYDGRTYMMQEFPPSVNKITINCIKKNIIINQM